MRYCVEKSNLQTDRQMYGRMHERRLSRYPRD